MYYLPPMKDEGREARVTIALTHEELERLDDWTYLRRVRGRSAAIRQLLELGLAASSAEWSPAAPPAKKPVGRKKA